MNNMTVKGKKKSAVLLISALLLTAICVMILHMSNNAGQAYASSDPAFFPELSVAYVYNFGENESLMSDDNETIVPLSASPPWLTVAAQSALRIAMRRSYFFVGSQRHYVNNYFSEFYSRSSTDGRVAGLRGPGSGLYNFVRPRGEITFNAPDPITNFIPRQVFAELNMEGTFTYIGDEWGVIIDIYIINYIRHFTVQVIEIGITDNLEGHNAAQNPLNQFPNVIDVLVRPLFEVEFVWLTANSGRLLMERVVDSASNVNRRTAFHRSADAQEYDFTVASGQQNNLFAVPLVIHRVDSRGNSFWTHTFGQRNRNYLRNVSVTARLSNAQDANPAHSGYSPQNDFGAFFNGQDLFGRAYNAANFNFSGSSNIRVYADLALLLAGHIPVVGDFISWGTDIWDVANLLNERSENQNLRNSSYANSLGSNFIFTPPDRVDHLRYNNNRFVREASVRFNNANAMLTLFPNNSSDPSLMRARFFVSQQHERLQDQSHYMWRQRLKTEITFDVHRYQNHAFSRTVRSSREQIIRDRDARTISEGQPVDVYNYYQNTSRFRFVPQETGIYVFNFANTAYRSRYRILSTAQAVVNSTGYLNRRSYLIAGQAYYFHLEYFFNSASIASLTIERAGSLIFTPIGNTGNAEVRLRQGVPQPSVLEIPSYAIINGALHPVTHIAVSGFQGFIGNEVLIPSSVSVIGAEAFLRAGNLTAVTFESDNTLTYIGHMAFMRTALRSIEIPRSVTRIGNSVFESADLRSVYIHAGITSIGTFAFAYNRSLTSLTFGTGSALNTIGNFAFEGSDIRRVSIPDRVATIGNSAFNSNSNLREVILKRAVCCEA